MVASIQELFTPHSGKVKSGNPTVDEIATATRKVVKVVQRQAFPKGLVVLSRISHGTPPSLTSVSQTSKLGLVGYVSPLQKLNPVMIGGVISVGGRLERASIRLSTKHPIILPGKHRVTDLIIRDAMKDKGC